MNRADEGYADMTLALGKDLLKIPGDVAHKVPCQVTPGLYTDRALDIDQDDEAWVALSPDQQRSRIAARQAAEARAVAACGTCPILEGCREWAVKQGAAVFGVAGGLTHEERTGDRLLVLDTRMRGPFGQVRDDLVERWSSAGVPTATIATWLECDVRTVERRRERLASGRAIRFAPSPALPAESPEEACGVTELTDAGLEAVNSGRAKHAVRAAATPLVPTRVSDETAALFDALSDGAQRDRSEIVDGVLHLVDRKTALAKAPQGRTYASDDDKARIGARKFIMNRLDIAVRSGRVIEVTTENGRKLVSMEPTSASVWREWRGDGDQAQAG